MAKVIHEGEGTNRLTLAPAKCRELSFGQFFGIIGSGWGVICCPVGVKMWGVR